MSDHYGGSAIMKHLPTGHNFSDEVLAEIRRRHALLHGMGFQPIDEVSAQSPQFSVDVGEPQMPPQYSVEVGAPHIEDSPQMQDSMWYGGLEQRGIDMMQSLDDEETLKRKAALASMGGL